MLAPFIENVPPEVLSDVFVFYHHHIFEYGRNAIPIALGLVCRRWRAVTLETPILWTRVDVEGEADHIAAHAPMINKWLARSGTLPCSVDACLWPVSRTFVMPGILLPIGSRLRDLRLCAGIEELVECQKLFDHGFPNLQVIKLELADDILSAFKLLGQNIPPYLPLDFSSFPRLKNVTLSLDVLEMLPDNDIVAILPPSLEIYRNDAMELALEDILRLLIKCPDLKSFNICNSFPSPPLPDSEFHFSHTSISTFGLSYDCVGTDTASVLPLFEAVQFPSLCELYLGHIPGLDGLLQHLAAASPPLLTLKLHTVPSTVEELLDFFELVPTINNLDLRNCGIFNSQFMSMLTLSTDHTARYLPNLKRFTIFGNDTTATDKDLIEFMESRWNVRVEGFSRIERVQIGDERVLKEEWITRLSVMEGEGLFCHLHGMARKNFAQTTISDREEYFDGVEPVDINEQE